MRGSRQGKVEAVVIWAAEPSATYGSVTFLLRNLLENAKAASFFGVIYINPRKLLGKVISIHHVVKMAVWHGLEHR